MTSLKAQSIQRARALEYAGGRGKFDSRMCFQRRHLPQLSGEKNSIFHALIAYPRNRITTTIGHDLFPLRRSHSHVIGAEEIERPRYNQIRIVSAIQAVPSILTCSHVFPTVHNTQTLLLYLKHQASNHQPHQQHHPHPHNLLPYHRRCLPTHSPYYPIPQLHYPPASHQ